MAQGVVFVLLSFFWPPYLFTANLTRLRSQQRATKAVRRCLVVVSLPERLLSITPFITALTGLVTPPAGLLRIIDVIFKTWPAGRTP
jgi:hypothetical protein